MTQAHSNPSGSNSSSSNPSGSKTVHWGVRQTTVPHWRFWLPLLFQVLLVLLIPIQSAYVQITGKPVILQTAPVDPYDLLRGYYVTLRYDISQQTTLEDLPGWDAVRDSFPTSDDEHFLQPVDKLYVVLEQPPSGNTQQPQPWTPVRVTGDRPTDLSPHQVALKGQYQGGLITYGLERYYIPDDQRNAINDHIREAQNSGDRESYVVEVKVTDQGTASPTALWVEGEEYRF